MRQHFKAVIGTTATSGRRRDMTLDVESDVKPHKNKTKVCTLIEMCSVIARSLRGRNQHVFGTFTRSRRARCEVAASSLRGRDELAVYVLTAIDSTYLERLRGRGELAARSRRARGVRAHRD